MTNFAKSLINGKYIPITQIPKAERAAVGGYKAQRGMSLDHARFKAARNSPVYQQVHQIAREAKSSPEAQKRGEQFATQHGFGGFTTRQGGKNTGKSHVVINKPLIEQVHSESPQQAARALHHTEAHEQQHANPKRSEYRLHYQIGNDPYKHGREEGRADYMTAGYRKNSNWRPVKGKKIGAYDQKAGNELMQDRLLGNKRAPKSTFGEGYRDMHEELHRKGVKHANDYHSPGSAFAYNHRKQITGGAMVAIGGGAVAADTHHRNKQKKQVNKSLGQAIMKPLEAIKPAARELRAARKTMPKTARRVADAPAGTVNQSSKQNTPGILRAGKKTDTKMAWGENGASTHTRTVTTGRQDNFLYRPAKHFQTTTVTRNGMGGAPQTTNTFGHEQGQFTNKGKVAFGGAVGAGGTMAITNARNSMQRRQTSGFAKSAPDQADVHVVGTLRRVKKVPRKAG